MTKSMTLTIVACMALMPVGCAKEAVKPSESVSESTAPSALPPAAGSSAGTSDAVAGNSDAYAPLSPTPDLDKAIADAKATKDKKKLAAAYASRGDYRTNEDAKAGQRVKYRAALSDYRNAMKADKTNSQAAAGRSQIEQIYTMMGRPIPGVAECDKVSETGTFKP